jgi:flagellar hook-associated protein 3 FlgL
MRVTPTISYRNFMAGLETLNSRLEEANLQIATGKKLAHLDDSPAGSAELVGLRADISEVDQFKSNGETVSYFLTMADSALNSVHNLVSSIFSKGSAAVSGATTQALRQAAAEEIRSLRDQILSDANTEVRGRYIFAGSKVLSQAFSITGDAVTYHGDGYANAVQVGDGLTVTQNVPGSEVFDDVFAGIETLVQALDGNDPTAAKAALGQFSGMLQGLSLARAQVGSDLGRLETQHSELDTTETNLRTRQGKVEDADMSKVVTELTTVKTALDATLTARSMMGQNNLFDFLA